MDPNNPQDPNSNTTGFVPTQAPPTDPTTLSTTAPDAPPALSTDQVISDIPQTFPETPPSPAPPFNTTAPEPPPSEGQTATTVVPATNPWDQTPNQPVSTPWPAPAPSSITPDLNSPETPPPPQQTTPPEPATNPTNQPNPFLQPQAGATFSMPTQPLGDPLSQAPTQETTPPLSESTVPNPSGNPSPDPLNTAFNPAAYSPVNSFSTPLPSESPVGQTTPPGQTITNQPSSGLTGFISTTSDTPPNPAQPGSAQVTENAAIQDQTISNSQSGTLDLSSLQSNQSPPPGTEGATPADANPTPLVTPVAPSGNMPMPTENAPTDLSHLIAGDDQQPQSMGNVYTPPVAPDQPAAGSPPPPQTPATESGAAQPPEKHLNLTKVLLVAGIPIILIVAALSAYLILGIGKSAPETTSLPVEQTQAPLTNPPEQITAPSPQTIPEPSAILPGPSLPPADSFPTASIEPSPSSAASTSGSAMDRLRARQSPSPAATASTSPESLTTP